MIYKVYNEAEPKAPVVNLMLVEYGDGVLLVVVDDDGRKKDNGNIIGINSNGYLKKYPNVSRDIGLCLADGGYISEKKP